MKARFAGTLTCENTEVLALRETVAALQSRMDALEDRAQGR